MFHCSRFEKQKGWRCGGLGGDGEWMQGGGRLSPSDTHIINTAAHSQMRVHTRRRETRAVFIHMSAHEHGACYLWGGGSQRGELGSGGLGGGGWVG